MEPPTTVKHAHATQIDAHRSGLDDAARWGGMGYGWCSMQGGPGTQGNQQIVFEREYLPTNDFIAKVFDWTSAPPP